MSKVDSTVFKCDHPNCEATAHTEAYAGRPNGWVVVWKDAPGRDDGECHFCGLAHAAEWTQAEAERQRTAREERAAREEREQRAKLSKPVPAARSR